MVKRKKKKSHNKGKYFTLFTLILFIGSALGFALFSKPADSTNTHERIFLTQNIFDTPISQEIQRDVLLIEKPNTHPKIPVERQIGGIWIEYNCSDCIPLISNLSQIANTYYPRVYISPDETNPSRITIMSWAKTEQLNEVNSTFIEDFICQNLIYPPDICALRSL